MMQDPEVFSAGCAYAAAIQKRFMLRGRYAYNVERIILNTADLMLLCNRN